MAAATRPFSLIALKSLGASGPELPMQVVQPKPTRLKPSASSYFCSPEPSVLYAAAGSHRLQDRRLELGEGVTATDLVLLTADRRCSPECRRQIRRIFRRGPRRSSPCRPRRIANMASEYRTTCGFFPVDAETLDYPTTSAAPPAGRSGRSLCAGARGLPYEDGRRSRFTEVGSGSCHRHAADGRPVRPRGPRCVSDVGSGSKRLADEIAEDRRWQTRYKVEGKDFDARPWRRRDRRHHLLHQHLQPQRDDRRGLVARNASRRA